MSLCKFVRALLGTGGGHTSFAMLFSQPVAWSTLDRVRVRVKVRALALQPQPVAWSTLVYLGAGPKR